MTTTPPGQPGSEPAPPASSANAPSTPGIRQLDIRTNYAWATGSISWNGTSSATTSGKMHDTPQYDSRSWVRIAYRVLDGGAWQLHYAQPDPPVNAANGGYQDFHFSFPGPVKDVQWDLCSNRLGKTYCTGWS